MGQMGPDITFDELKKMYLDSLGLLDKKVSENAALVEKVERLEKELRPLKEISGSCRCEYGEYCENLAMAQKAGGELYDSACKRADAAEADNVCDACAGTGKPISGKPCMCKGTGKMSDAAVYLRQQLVTAEAKLGEVVPTFKETTDLLEELLSTEPDMPSYQSTYDAADKQVEKARAILDRKTGDHRRVATDVIIEASDEVVKEAIQEAGESPERLIRKGKAAIRKALSQYDVLVEKE